MVFGPTVFWVFAAPLNMPGKIWLVSDQNARPGLQPSRMPLTIETQADGLGWYGVAPSVLDFVATRTSALQAGCYPSPGPAGEGHLGGAKPSGNGLQMESNLYSDSSLDQ
jgi:hypothetical protein